MVGTNSRYLYSRYIVDTYSKDFCSRFLYGRYIVGTYSRYIVGTETVGTIPVHIASIEHLKGGSNIGALYIYRQPYHFWIQFFIQKGIIFNARNSLGKSTRRNRLLQDKNI